MTRTREENAADLAQEEQTQCDPSQFKELRACLGQLLEQVYQIQGMFDDGDEAIAQAVEDAEQILEATNFMKFGDALEIVLEMAKQNLADRLSAPALHKHRELAISVVNDWITNNLEEDD